jgi:hypothetical protein
LELSGQLLEAHELLAQAFFVLSNALLEPVDSILVTLDLLVYSSVRAGPRVQETRSCGDFVR